MERQARILPQPSYKQIINVVATKDDSAKTIKKPCSSVQFINETEQKPNELKSGIQSYTMHKNALCQNPVHAATRRPVKASKRLPCQHILCDKCVDKNKSIIGDYVVCIKCYEQCCPRYIEKIDTWMLKKTEASENFDTKQTEHSQTPEKNNDIQWCDYTKCQQKQVTASETIFLSCNHRFCYRCFSKNMIPEVSIEDYICIKCPNCEDDGERWYTDDYFEPFFEQNRENYRYYKTVNISKGSFMDEIKCIIKQKDICFEARTWKCKDVLYLNVWSALKERVRLEYQLQPIEDGLYKVEIPIEGEIYFFKISNMHESKWFGPVERQQEIPKAENIEIKHISSNSVELSWTLGKPYKYIDIHRCSIEKWSTANSVWEPCHFVKYPRQLCTIEHLKETTRYTFRLICCSSVGDIECSKFDVETKSIAGNLKGKPFTPSHFAIQYMGIDKGLLKWNEPPCILTSKVIKYIIEMKEGDRKWEEVYEAENILCITCPFQKMEDGKDYYFRIAACNSIGRSEPRELGHTIRRKQSLGLQDTKEKDKKPNGNSTSECPSGKGKDRIQKENQASEYPTDKGKAKKTTENSTSKYPTEKDKNKKTIETSTVKCPTGKNKDMKTNDKSASQCQTDKKTIARRHDSTGTASEYQTDKAKGKENETPASECQTSKHKDKKKEEETCSKCCEVKPLECILSCEHKYCLECSFDLYEHAIECFDGERSVFMWVCTSCDTMTGEQFLEFTGTVFHKKTFPEARKFCEQQKQKTEHGQEHTVSHDKDDVGTKERIRGLPNVGMTCYSNCIFQILAQTNSFYNHLDTLVMDYKLNKTKSVTGLLLRTLSEINRKSGDEWSNRVDYSTIVRLIETISESDQSFQRGEQADCHSFMMALFNGIKDEIQTTEERSNEIKTGESSTQHLSDGDGNKDNCERTEEFCSLTRDAGGMLVKKQAKRNKKGPLSQFEGFTTNVFFYESCSHKEMTERQLFNSLLIPIEEKMFGNWTVCNGLEVLQKKETFLETTVPCRTCNIGHQRRHWWRNRTTKQQIFIKLPDVLVLQLGKFEKGYYSPIRKIYDTVDYPHELKLKEYNDPDTKWEYSEKTYRLYGVTLHSGTIYGGHYSAFVRCKDNENSQAKTAAHSQWFYCSDSNVQKVSEKKVINNSKASVLFYELIDSEYHI